MNSETMTVTVTGLPPVLCVVRYRSPKGISTLYPGRVVTGPHIVLV